MNANSGFECKPNEAEQASALCNKAGKNGLVRDTGKEPDDEELEELRRAALNSIRPRMETNTMGTLRHNSTDPVTMVDFQ